MKPVKTNPSRRIVPFPVLSGKNRPGRPWTRERLEAIGGTPPPEASVFALGMALSVTAGVRKLPPELVAEIRDAFEIVYRVLSEPVKGVRHAE